ncbi:MAG: YqaE/Pmp3 family membrane protein [Oscillatoriales cyanobacterium RU_3_3]|nr:YqaE/Pmp3 family membrane protein [Oscillatoriales cyanobacterium RU_3_3]NJS41769.1 YqaE/Pmp3 family membrane protein [Candidatus Gracilibacteria bacterium]
MKSKTSGIGLPTAVIVPHLPEKCYNIILTLLGGVPGIIHAIWVIAKHDRS